MGKKTMKKSADNLDLFEMRQTPKASNVVSFCGAIDRKKSEGRSSLEHDALKAILKRASKLNW